MRPRICLWQWLLYSVLQYTTQRRRPDRVAAATLSLETLAWAGKLAARAAALVYIHSFLLGRSPSIEFPPAGDLVRRFGGNSEFRREKDPTALEVRATSERTADGLYRAVATRRSCFSY